MVISGGVRVLVVEDSEDQAGLLQRYLERAGCTVTMTCSAEAATLAYGREVPELAIIDLQLPGMDGATFAAQLSRDCPSCAIAITSVLDQSSFPPADAALPKPFTGAQVRQVLSDTIPRWSAL